MKNVFLLTLVLIIMSAVMPARADSSKPEFFLNFGGRMGWDVNTDVLGGLGGGPNFGAGFAFNDFAVPVALALESGLYFTQDRTLNYFNVPFILTAKANLYKGLFVKGGVGYDLLFVEQGVHFRGTRGSIAKAYHGVTGQAAVGYDVKVNDKITVSPQTSFDYTRTGGVNRMQISGNVNVIWFVGR